MKKTKVENVSKVKLEFFLIQNKNDIKVMLGPGESSWFDSGTTTKSMILYNRKNLIKIDEEESTMEENLDVNNDETLDKLHTTEDIRTVSLDIIPPISLNEPDKKLFLEIAPDSIEQKGLPPISDIEYLQNKLFNSLNVPKEVINEILTPLERAQKETKEYKEESEKTYKGKKRGRKKKRGPKPGSKKKKANNPPTISEDQTKITITGTTS